MAAECIPLERLQRLVANGNILMRRTNWKLILSLIFCRLNPLSVYVTSYCKRKPDLLTRWRQRRDFVVWFGYHRSGCIQSTRLPSAVSLQLESGRAILTCPFSLEFYSTKVPFNESVEVTRCRSETTKNLSMKAASFL